MTRFLLVALVLSSLAPHPLLAKPESYREVAFSASYESAKAKSAEVNGQVTEVLIAELESYFKIENEEERKEEIRSLVVFRHRQDFAHLTKRQLERLLPLGNDDWRMTLLMLNFNWLKDHPEMAEHFPAGTFAKVPAFLASRGLSPEDVIPFPTIPEMEEKYGFDASELKPLVLSALEYFCVGKVYPHELVYYFSMSGSSVMTQVAREIVADTNPKDPQFLGLQLLCDFELDSIPFQPRTILIKYLYGRVRRDTFKNWFGLAHQPELLERLLAATEPTRK